MKITRMTLLELSDAMQRGDLTSREAGYVGGYMVKRLIEHAEQQMAGQNG